MKLRVVVVVVGLALWPVGVAAQARDTGKVAGAGVTRRAAPAPAGEGGRRQEFGRDFRLGFDVTLGTVEAPLHWSRAEWVTVPAAALALATLSGADQPLQGVFDRNHSGAASGLLNTVEPLGEKAGIATVVGAYVAGWALDVPGLRRAGVEAAASSIVASGIVTPALKRLVGRSRPWQARGPFAFHALTGNESFPSGHATQAFAAASVFAAEAHPLWAKAAIYALAGGVATARMYHDAHFLSDVAAGATIGTVVGRSVVARAHAQPGVRGGRGALAPYVGDGGVGLALSF